MKVYLLYINYDYESCDILEGVYSTLEKAKTASEMVSKRFYSRIEEEELK